jgi:hypothetical protein
VQVRRLAVLAFVLVLAGCGGSEARKTGTLPPLEKHGHWIKVLKSPDGDTLLAQWSGECEEQTAYFIPADGGKPTPVTGKREWSEALGWTDDGLARVRLANGACGSSMHKPGVFLIDPKTHVMRPAS